MTTPQTTPEVQPVSTRNLFSLALIIDDAIVEATHYFPNLANTPIFRGWLERFSRQLLFETTFSMSRAAASAVERAAAIIQNPNLDETRRRQRKQRVEMRAERARKDKKEQQDNEFIPPDATEIRTRQIRLKSSIEMYRRIADAYEKDLKLLSTDAPTVIAKSQSGRLQ